MTERVSPLIKGGRGDTIMTEPSHPEAKLKDP